MHLVEHLQVEVDFSGDLAAPEAEARLAAFAQGPALAIVDELFDAACGPEEVWRIDALSIDLGEVPAERMEETWALRLRERLQAQLSDLRGPGGLDAARRRAGAVQRSRPQARLETLLYYLRHGHMPWHARGDDPQRLGAEVLQHSGDALAGALRSLDDRARLLRRLVAQFDAQWLAALVQALLPGEPAAAARLLQAGALARDAGRGTENGALLWEAVVEQALQHSTAPQGLSVALLRAQLRVALDAGHAMPQGRDPLLAIAQAWAPLLRDDRAWLRATLQRLGDSAAVQQRIARALPAHLLPQVMALWGGAALALQNLDAAATGTPAPASAQAGPGEPGPHAAPGQAGASEAPPPARLQALLHYLRHGHMPNHAHGEDPQRLATEVLQRSGAALAAALRAMDDQPPLLRRLAAQFDTGWLADLVRALLPGAPLAAQRLLQAAAPATDAGRGLASALRLWEAVLAQALHMAAPTQDFGLPLLRAQLQLALDAGQGSPDRQDPLRTLTPVWAPLLQGDPAGLQALLRQQGHGAAIAQRLARAVPAGLLAEVMAAWQGSPADATEQLRPDTPAADAAAQRPAVQAHDTPSADAPPLPRGRDAVPHAAATSALQSLLQALRHSMAAGADGGALAAALRHSAPALAAALRAMDGRPVLLRRLAMRCDADTLAALLQVLMPGAPAAATPLLQAAAPAFGAGRGSEAAVLLCEAVLAQALSAPTQQPGLPLLRAQLQCALEAGPAQGDPLEALAQAWAPLLRDERPWLQATLQRLGGSSAMRRRVARAVPPALLPQVMALWRADAAAVQQVEQGAHAPTALQSLLAFLRHGHAPAQAGATPRQWVAEALQHDAPALATALRAIGDRPVLLRRLAAHIDATGLAALVHALMPGEPAAAALLLRAAAPAAAANADSSAPLWQAVLDVALAPAASRQRSSLPLLRAQLRVALQAGPAGAPGRDALRAASLAWAPLLQHDRAWLRATLHSLGDSAIVQQRIAQAVPPAQRQQLMALWPAATAADIARPERDAAPTSPVPTQNAEPSAAAVPDGLPTLLHYLRHGHLPTHAERDPQALATQALQQHAPAFAIALRAMPDRPRLLRRLATQFNADWLAALVHALLPGQPAAAARLLQAAAPAMGTGQRQPGAAPLWEAVLAQALSPAAAPQGAVPLLRAQLQLALEAGAGTGADPLQALAPVWAPLLQHDPAWLQASLQRVGDSAAQRQRIVQALPAAQLPQVMALWFGTGLTGAVQNWIASVAAGSPAPQDALQGRRDVLWQATLLHALQGGASAFDAARYAEQVRAQVVTASPASAPHWFERAVRAATALLAAAAAALGRPQRRRAARTPGEALPPTAWAFDVPEASDTLPVGNAGLALLTPYVPRLFMMLGLADERAFTGPAAAERGVQLLQLLATGEADAPEPALVLNKLLCGLDQAQPVPRRFDPSDAERQAIDGLLAAVIQHWKVLGTTSLAGLRQTFVLREGRLQRKDEAWQLQVVPGPFDMLIDQLPWGYSTVRFPWMKQVLHVEWR